MNNFNITGLNDEQVFLSRKKWGANVLDFKKENWFWSALKSLIREPMIILLLVTSVIYFLSGKTGDAIFLASAVLLVAVISLVQDSKSRRALEKLKELSQPKSKVIRNGQTIEIKSDEIVVGDCIVTQEGTCIGADGTIIHANDFAVNESILTGESMAVYKDQSSRDNSAFCGTTVVGGLAIVEVTFIGNNTKLGKIGKSLESIQEEKTPLEIQINQFVHKMVIAGAFVFAVVWVLNYLRSAEILDSLLKALTLAMSILPEEIPVAFTTFMALGAWRLMKMGVVVKQMKTVETLGSASVICTDKTGTLTENKMTLVKLFVPSSNRISSPEESLNQKELELIQYAMWASEPVPFDPMEKALHQAYSNIIKEDVRIQFRLIHEYPLGGTPPMMTHVFENYNGHRIIAAKGAPEALLALSNTTPNRIQNIQDAINNMANEGYRLLGVGEAIPDGKIYPQRQQDFKFNFKGIVAFADPPKKNIQSVLTSFYQAGIDVKIVTGDNAVTTVAIAKQIGFHGYDKSISGEELMKLSDSELESVVISKNVFTRMFPEAKLRIIDALKSNNKIVAMTGDGVNDGPALKAAHIGIAMGKKGSDLAKQAASLILMNDDLSKMVEAISMGRKIYTNLKKAIQYIISIHIPIILTVFIPLAMGWIYPNIFLPTHIIFLELIMGPTCSIIYENEPVEENAMTLSPRPFTKTFFNSKELFISILQGIVITAGSLFVYQYAVQHGFNEAVTRTMVFVVLISSNIFLTLVNRSFHYSVFTTLRHKNNLVLLIISITLSFTIMLIGVQPLARFFSFERITTKQLGICIGIALISVSWFELFKWQKRRSQHET